MKDPPRKPERSEALSALATGVIELMRPQRSEDELDPLCDRLKTLVGASRVAVSSQTGAKTILVSVGSVLRSSGTRTGREEGARTALEFDTGGGTKAAAPIRVHDRNEPIANLLVWWSQPPSAATRLIVAPLLRLASVILAPSVQLALDRQVSSKVDHRTGLAGCSRQIADLRASVVQQASCPFGILIEGETGSGKEVVARALHHASGRRGAAFCAVNCAAVTDELFEAELFGHSRGAFTGAVTHRAGLFEAAHRGTLFLDEVGELSPRAQAKLLRAVQDGEVRRIGENTTRHVDVRIIAATNRTLQSEVEAGRFRQDLPLPVGSRPNVCSAAAQSRGGHRTARKAILDAGFEPDGWAGSPRRRHAGCVGPARLARKCPGAGERDCGPGGTGPEAWVGGAIVPPGGADEVHE